MPLEKTCFGLLRWRQCLLPTWRAYILFIGIGGLLAALAVRELHSFLAVNDPKPGGVLVIEGWASDQVMEATVAEFKRNHYEKLLVIGGPLDHGGPLAQYKTLAELGAAEFLKLGLDTNQVQAVPAPRVRKDRTYAALVALRDWLRARGMTPNNFNLVSAGPHGRRSRLLFEKVFGKDVTVGVMSLTDDEYDPDHWWRSSQGFRVVTSEAIAYLYSRFLFREPDDPGKPAEPRIPAPTPAP